MSTSDSDGAGALSEYLASRDVPCPGCGYNLRGLDSPFCPECGGFLSLRDLTDPDHVRLPPAWWACYVPLTILAVLGVVAGVTFVVVAVTRWLDGPDGSVFWFIVAALVVLGFVVVQLGWVGNARVGARWPGRRLWSIAVLLWLMLGVVMFSVITAMRLATMD